MGGRGKGGERETYLGVYVFIFSTETFQLDIRPIMHPNTFRHCYQSPPPLLDLFHRWSVLTEGTNPPPPLLHVSQRVNLPEFDERKINASILTYLPSIGFSYWWNMELDRPAFPAFRGKCSRLPVLLSRRYFNFRNDQKEGRGIFN